MELRDSTIVITGAGGGIGAALAQRFAAEGAAHLVLADIDGDAVGATADVITGTSAATAEPIVADLSTEAGNRSVVAAALGRGPIDLLCCNAGIAIGGGVETDDDGWDRSWRINVMAHVWAVRAALPSMLERGSGHILTTASAAGLLTNLGAAPYSVTKHGAVALAEWLAITHGDDGIGVSCLCPQGVRTRMLFPDGEDFDDAGANAVRSQGVIEPEDVAASVVAGLAEDRFLILPHPEVADYERARAADRARWIGGMRKLWRSVRG